MNNATGGAQMVPQQLPESREAEKQISDYMTVSRAPSMPVCCQIFYRYHSTIFPLRLYSWAPSRTFVGYF
jgi:hypothetical protein